MFSLHCRTSKQKKKSGFAGFHCPLIFGSDTDTALSNFSTRFFYITLYKQRNPEIL